MWLLASISSGANGRLPAPNVAVDSTFAGYNSAVLSDGKWIDYGQEPTGFQEFGNPGNTWVSADNTGDHWIELHWTQPVTLDEVHVWWSVGDWYPHGFRVERWEDGKWISARGKDSWLEVTDRRTIIPLPRTQTQAIRIFQPPAGACQRRFLAVQEVLAFDRGGKPGKLSGARPISTQAMERLVPRPLARNIARLNDDFPGAVSPLSWSKGKSTTNEKLVDGNSTTRAVRLKPAHFAGVMWPIEHSIDGASLSLEQPTRSKEDFTFEVSDGEKWFSIPFAVECKLEGSDQRLTWTFEPLAARGVRIGLRRGEAVATELEVFRYLPTSHVTWPARLTESNGFQNQILALPGEPSYDRVALGALSMRTARAVLGLKDTLHESGVSWDGTIQGRAKITFHFGEEQYRLAEFPETTRWQLIDGWRPGVEITSQLHDLKVSETAFVVPTAGDAKKPALFLRLTIKNLSKKTQRTSVQARVESDRSDALRFQEGALVRSNRVELLALTGREGDLPFTLKPSAAGLTFDFDLPPGSEAYADFIHPQESVAPGAALASYHELSFASALADFRRYWDEMLASPTRIETPEPRVNRMIKAVLAQIFINGDGDIMPYGSAPSVYEGSLFGLEESYPILGLALFGFEDDAQRYTQATLLTREFLKKAERYVNVDDRHQQYRNGLEPHYAINAYRLTRDKEWMRRNLPLLKDCAEWTLAQRRRTMVEENGQRPLAWGLLPKWSYGGDVVSLECHPFYANYCCWRGLVDTAWLLDELGDHLSAKLYAEDAVSYRADIDRALEGSFLKNKNPPYVPLRVSGEKPDELPDFYQLFSGCLLDLEPFTANSKHEQWITSFMEKDNRTFCLLPRYREAGAGGLDALYGKGYFLGKLHSGATREFLLSFYAYLAFNLERDTFASRESNVIYASDRHARSVFGNPDVCDPLPCSSAVALHLVRNMLVTEERGEPGKYSGNLLLMAGTPAAWLEDGKKITLQNTPTHFGPMSMEIRSHLGHGVIEADLTPPTRQPCRTIQLRLPHPDGTPIHTVRFNGRAWKDFDGTTGVIRLPGDSAPGRLNVEYRRVRK